MLFMPETPQHNALDVIDEIFEKLTTVNIQNINSTCNFSEVATGGVL